MSSNIIKTDNGFQCSKCGNLVGEKDSFCRICGVPLTTEATILRSEQNLNIKLNTIEEIIEITKDPKIIDYLKNLKQ